MAEIIVHKSHGHTSMSTYHLWDKTITLGAKGLLSQMFSLPDEWDFSIKGLIELNQEGERAVTSALRELKTKGYLTVEKIPPSKGENKFTYLYNIFETPQTKDVQDPHSVGVQNVGLQDVGVQDAVQEKKEKNQKKEEKSLLNISSESLDLKDTKDIQSNKDNESTDTKKLSTKQDKISLKNKIIHLIDEYTDNDDLRKSLNDFVIMREKHKKPVPTEHAMEVLLKNLTNLCGNDMKRKIATVNKAVAQYWMKFYPLKQEDIMMMEERQTDLDYIF